MSVGQKNVCCWDVAIVETGGCLWRLDCNTAVSAQHFSIQYGTGFFCYQILEFHLRSRVMATECLLCNWPSVNISLKLFWKSNYQSSYYSIHVQSSRLNTYSIIIQYIQLLYHNLYNNQIDAQPLWLVNQLCVIVLVNPRKNPASSELLYKSNRSQVSMGFRLINHLGCWYNTQRIRKPLTCGSWFTNSSRFLPTSLLVYQLITHRNLWSIAYITLYIQLHCIYTNYCRFPEHFPRAPVFTLYVFIIIVQNLFKINIQLWWFMFYNFGFNSVACLAALQRHGECLALVNKRLEEETENPDLFIMRARLHELFRNVSAT